VRSVHLIKYYAGDEIKKDSIGSGKWHVWGRGEMHTEFWCGNLRERGLLEDTGVTGMVI
jgi:hypothetical protein